MLRNVISLTAYGWRTQFRIKNRKIYNHASILQLVAFSRILDRLEHTNSWFLTIFRTSFLPYYGRWSAKNSEFPIVSRKMMNAAVKLKRLIHFSLFWRNLNIFDQRAHLYRDLKCRQKLVILSCDCAWWKNWSVYSRGNRIRILGNYFRKCFMKIDTKVFSISLNKLTFLYFLPTVFTKST